MREGCIGKETFNSFTEAMDRINNSPLTEKGLYSCCFCNKWHMKDSLDIWLDNLDINAIRRSLYS